MGFKDWLNSFGKTATGGQFTIVNNDSEYDYTEKGTLQIPEQLKETNGFELANCVPEIYFPIDFIADRISKLRFFIADKSGSEVENSEFNRFVSDINPLYSFSDLVYQYLFSYLADGNVFSYLGSSKSFNKISVGSINRIDILQPQNVSLYEYSNVSLLDASSLNEIIRRADYNDNTGKRKPLDIQRLIVNTADATRRGNSIILSRSPLHKAKKSIDNLLAVYSARYNVYVNNGAAGYLVRKVSGGSANLEMQGVIDPPTRDEMLKDINNRNGLTGNRNLWGISSVPLEWIQTMATISELQPFEETLEDSIKIASVFQLPPVLIPRKDQSTFDNQSTAEASVWENALMSIAEMFAANWTKICTLDKQGYKVLPDYSTVSALKQNESEQQDVITKKLDNLKKLKEIYGGVDGVIDSQTEYIIKAEINNIYGQGK